MAIVRPKTLIFKGRNCPYNPIFSIKFLILTKSFRFHAVILRERKQP